MIGLEDLKTMWKTDSTIDSDSLDKEALRSGVLHSRYLDIHTSYRLRLSKLNSEMALLKSLKTRYYKGQLTKKELEAQGWEQYQYELTKAEIKETVDSDEDVVKLQLKIDYVVSVLEFTQNIITQIRSRSYDIKNAIEWRKFEAGM